MQLIVLILVCVEVAHCIYHTKSMGRKYKHHGGEIKAKPHEMGHPDVTTLDQLKGSRIIRFLVPDDRSHVGLDNQDGVRANQDGGHGNQDDNQDGNHGNKDDNLGNQDGRSFDKPTEHQWRPLARITHSRSAHGSRPRKMRQARGQRSIIIKVLQLPVENPHSLSRYLSRPRPNAQSQ